MMQRQRPKLHLELGVHPRIQHQPSLRLTPCLSANPTTQSKEAMPSVVEAVEQEPEVPLLALVTVRHPNTVRPN